MSRHDFIPDFSARDGLRDRLVALSLRRRRLGRPAPRHKGDQPHDHPHDHDYMGKPGPARYAATRRKTFTLGVAGPVGSGKTALVERLCRELWPEINLAVITNDIYTHEDAEFLSRRKVLPLERIVGVQTGGCPHTAIRDDASANLSTIANLERQFPELEMVIVESGGDNLTAVFSRELADVFIFVIDVAEGDKIPRKGGPGICTSDLLVINKIDLAPHVGADLDVMRRDSLRMRGERPFLPDQPPSGRRGGGRRRMGPSNSSHHGRRLRRPRPSSTDSTGAAFGRSDWRRAVFNLASPTAGRPWPPATSKFPCVCCPPFNSPASRPRSIYLINPTAGLLDGDGHLVEIDAAAGTRAVVTGQSATRIHPAVNGFSTQQWRVHAAADSQLVLLPGPNIPFRGCRYHQKAAIEIAAGAQAHLGRHLDARSIRPDRSRGRVSRLRARRPGPPDPPEWHPDLPRSLHLGWPLGRVDRAMARGQSSRNRDRGTLRYGQSRAAPSGSRAAVSASGTPACPRRHARPLVRFAPRHHHRPGEDRVASRRRLVRQRLVFALVDRCKPPGTEPLVLAVMGGGHSLRPATLRRTQGPARLMALVSL